MQFNAKYSPIGIDLGGSPKLVQFRLKGNPPQPELHATASLTMPIPNNGNTEAERETFVKKLKKSISNARFGSRRAIIALPASDVHMRPLTLPVDEHDLAKRVRWEAESYIEGPIENAVIDHVVLGKATTAGERRLEVLALSADKSKVVSTLDLLASTGLTTDTVDIIPLALCRALQATHTDTDNAVAAIDIGAQTTTTVIVMNDELRMARPIAIGGDTLTEAIQTALEISQEEAEILKIQHGAGSAGTEHVVLQEEPNKIAQIVHDILREHLDRLADELVKLFRYFSAQHRGRTVERVFLVGGSGALKHLDELLASRLNAQVSVGEPLAQITGSEIELKRGNDSSYAVAAGLALRGL